MDSSWNRTPRTILGRPLSWSNYSMYYHRRWELGGRNMSQRDVLQLPNWLFSTSMCRENDQLNVPPVLHIDWLWHSSSPPLTSHPGFTARSRKDWGEREGQCKGCLYNNHSISPGKVGVQPVPNLDISLRDGNTNGQETTGASAPLKSSSRYQILNRKISYLIKCGKYLKMFQSCKGADEGKINVSARKDL